MEDKEIKPGDFVRHRFLNKSTDLLVVLNNETKLLVRYVKDGVFHSEEFYLFEVEYYEKKPFKSPDIYIG